MSNESLLQMISDAQMSTEAYRSVTTTREKIIEDLKDTINELLKLYNRVNGQSLILADYTKVAREIQAIDNWKGEAFQSDDEVDIALQAIAQEIDFPRNGSQKRITNADLDIATEMRTRAMNAKTKYTLWAYSNGSYNNVADAMESGGNWEIGEFELSVPLTLELVKEDGGVVDSIRQIAVNAFDVFGHIEDAVFFITDILETSTDESPVPTTRHCCGRILFEENEKGEWVKFGAFADGEKPDEPIQQATIPITIFVTATGANLSAKENEIRAKMTDVVQNYINHSDSDKFETEFADSDVAVVETKVLCTDPITYHDIQ